MIGKLFRSSTVKPAPRPARAPDDHVVWVIGDIHGTADLLRPLLEAIGMDLDRDGATRRVLVCLGDYIDRGPDSRGVLDSLIAFARRPEVETYFLRGNHEDRMEAFLTDPDVGPVWCDYGGRETLGSFGIAPPARSAGRDVWEAASAALDIALSPEHRAFLAAQKYSLTLGDYFFCHAGAEPGTPLDRQDPEQLMWIRRRFTDHPDPFEKMIVHGHTPVPEVHIDHRRIALDTGAYATGVLSALRLRGEDRGLLQAVRAGTSIDLRRRPLKRL
jgi:serine/threonine protein phosphatase 1